MDRDRAARESEGFVTAGVDIGMRAVKVALLAHRASRGSSRVLASEIVTVPRRSDVRDAQSAVRDAWARALRGAGLVAADVALVASTGQRPTLARVGHFYRRLSLTAGVRFLFPEAVAVLDVGARQIRCTRFETLGHVRAHATCPRGATWRGDGLDDIARTDGCVIFEAIRPPGATAAYEDVAARASKLMHLVSFEGPTAITGAMAVDSMFLSILARRMIEDRLGVGLLIVPDAVFIGAYGAALLAARRVLRAARLRRPRRDSSRLEPWSPARRAVLN